MRTDRPPDEKTTTGMTLEQVDEYLSTKLGATVNNMLTARMTTFEKKLKESLGTTVGEALKAQLPEFLKDFKPSTEGEKTPEGKKGKDVELDSLKRQMAEMNTALQESRDLAARELEKNRMAALNAKTTDRLASLGQIHGTGAKLALMALRERIGYGEGDQSDNEVFRGDDGVIVDLETGLKQWLKSDEAKFFQAPSGVRGSGSRPPVTQQLGSAPVSREQATTNAMSYLGKALQNEFRGVDQIDDP